MSKADKIEWAFLAFVGLFIIAQIVRGIATRNVPAPW